MLLSKSNQQNAYVKKKSSLIHPNEHRNKIETMTSDRIERRKRIHVTNPNYFVENP